MVGLLIALIFILSQIEHLNLALTTFIVFNFLKIAVGLKLSLLITVMACNLCPSLLLRFGLSLHALSLLGLLAWFLAAAGVLVLSLAMLDKGNLLLHMMVCE